MIRRYLKKELTRTLDAMADPSTRLIVSVRRDATNFSSSEDLVTPDGSLVPARQLATCLQSDRAKKCQTVVLDLALIHVDDVYLALNGVAEGWSAESRLMSVSYSRFWRPFVRGSRLLGAAQHLEETWIPPDEIVNQLEQTGFEVIERRTAVIFPLPIPIISVLFNRLLAPLPIIRHFCIYNIIIARPISITRPAEPSVSIVVAARNESGNIGPLVHRIPQLSSRQELVFIEGGSTDDTWDAIQEVKKNPPLSGMTIKAFKQQGIGKGDAVRLGFAEASGDIIIILDADISVPPEELTRFIELLRNNVCEFANGSRLLYPMEKQAMQFLNLVGNRLFGAIFTFLLGQPVRDTLCGTKALWADDYLRIAKQRKYFGDFDPFGDFDLLFGAARLHLKIRDVPVHYKERVYGSTNISRFRHGLLLFRMTLVAARKLRFV